MSLPTFCRPRGLSAPARASVLGFIALGALAIAAPAALAGPFDDAMAIVQDAKRLSTESDRALSLFRQAVTADPKLAHGHYNIGLLLMREGDADGAREAFARAVAVDAEYLSAQARTAELDLNAGKAAAATAELERLVGINRYQAEARNVLARLAIEAEEWEEVIRHSRNVLLGDPMNMQAYTNIAMAYFAQGRIEQAWLVAKSALDRNPKAASLHNMMGIIYLHKDDSRLAASSFLRALAEDPTLEDARLNLAALELGYGDFETALARFDKALEARPKDARLVMSRAVALRGLKRFEDAAAGYEAALALDPTLNEANYNLCVLYQQHTSEFDKAEPVCKSYFEGLQRKHPKYREMKRRVKSLEATLEVLREAAREAAEAAAADKAAQEAEGATGQNDGGDDGDDGDGE